METVLYKPIQLHFFRNYSFKNVRKKQLQNFGVNWYEASKLFSEKYFESIRERKKMSTEKKVWERERERERANMRRCLQVVRRLMCKNATLIFPSLSPRSWEIHFPKIRKLFRIALIQFTCLVSLADHLFFANQKVCEILSRKITRKSPIFVECKNEEAINLCTITTRFFPVFFLSS